jgi:hypothetical protein
LILEFVEHDLTQGKLGSKYIGANRDREFAIGVASEIARREQVNAWLMEDGSVSALPLVGAQQEHTVLPFPPPERIRTLAAKVDQLPAESRAVVEAAVDLLNLLGTLSTESILTTAIAALQLFHEMSFEHQQGFLDLLVETDPGASS